MMRIFMVVDETATHWVIAADEADAVAVVCESHGRLDADHASMDVTELTQEEAKATPAFDEDGEMVGTLWEEYEKFPQRSYVGGSERRSASVQLLESERVAASIALEAHTIRERWGCDPATNGDGAKGVLTALATGECDTLFATDILAVRRVMADYEIAQLHAKRLAEALDDL